MTNQILPHNPGTGNPPGTGKNTPKFFNVNSLLWLALALALAGSLKHLAAIFASVDGSTLMGWLQAVAIDTGLFALAYSIRQRKTASRDTRPLWFGVTLFSAISIYGNLSYGLMHSGNLPGWIVAIKPYILAGSLPVLVLFLSELLSDDRQFSARQVVTGSVNDNHKAATESAGDKRQLVAQVTTESVPQPVSGKAAKLQQLTAILTDNPEATNTELATMLDVSRGTIRNYRQEIAANGNGRVK